MTWKAINEAPVGFQPLYSVLEPETGRHIATDLEYYEAFQVANAPEMYEIIENSVKAMEELYVHYPKKDRAFLESVNEILTKMYTILDKIPREPKI